MLKSTKLSGDVWIARVDLLSGTKKKEGGNSGFGVDEGFLNSLHRASTELSSYGCH